MTDFSDFSGSTDAESTTQSTFIDIDTSDAREPQAVPDGEYKIRITGYRKDGDGNIIRTSEKGNRYFIVTFDIPEEEFSKGLSKIFSLPSADMEPKRANAVKWELECFKRCFGIVDLDLNALVGKEGWAILICRNDPQYGEQNDIKKFITGA
jgi:hypothetical protein